MERAGLTTLMERRLGAKLEQLVLERFWGDY